MKLVTRLSRIAAPLVFCTWASAEPLYEVESKVLLGSTLFEQTVLPGEAITVKPKLPADAAGDLRAMDQCLWSIMVTKSGQGVEFLPGKMICIGPEREVLETVPEGKVTPFTQCDTNTCEQISVEGDVTVVMSLTAPIQLSLQPRNERN